MAMAISELTGYFYGIILYYTDYTFYQWGFLCTYNWYNSGRISVRHSYGDKNPCIF